MIVPLSSGRTRGKVQSPTPHAGGAHRVPYMPTALAVQLLPDDEGEPLGGRMGLLEHLEELRRRLIRCCVAVAIGMLVAFLFIDRIVTFVLAPSRRMLPAGARLIYTQPGEGFGFYVQVALMAGTLIAAPFLMWQVWQFIAPGLYAREKRFAVPFVVLTSLGAMAGAAFSHYVLFPSLIAFFGTFNSPDLGFMPRLEDVFDLYTKMLLGMAVVFQIPTLAFFLAKMRLVTAGWLWQNVKYAVLVIFIVAAVLTPTGDPWNQLVFAAPMLGLYLLSIAIAWAVQPRQTPRPE
jgi:sec-independent protein translocase protein TatC